MLLLKNTQTAVETVKIEGQDQPYVTTGGERRYVVRDIYNNKFQSIAPDALVSVNEPPRFQAEIESEKFAYPDYAVWCQHCHAFIGWASLVPVSAHCRECRNTTNYYASVRDDINLYVKIQQHHYHWSHGPSDDDYHDGMYNAHQQTLERLEARWNLEGFFKVLERLIDQYDVSPEVAAKHFKRLAEAQAEPEPALVGAL
jgi:hypothetical protein